MATNSIYEPKYAKSWLLAIGINSYTKAPPLGYARQDAEAFAKLATERLGFPTENVTLLVDDKATRSAITHAFLNIGSGGISENDRIVVFFAGHGHTQSGRRGEVGFLVPVDGSSEDLSSLIRWDDLTRNSDLITAKHMLFIMDACYGGLAITRTLPPGSQRFLKDMLQRYSRQVLTAGKADEVVADSGGPRAGHSIFTGHLLDALDGKAATGDGVISANAVMAYVYQNVSKDPNSRQTPHYGFLDGDGDFIFASPSLADLETSQETDKDMLIQVPAGKMSSTLKQETELVDLVKDYLSDPKAKIRLDDLAGSEIRSLLELLGESSFPSETVDVGKADFIDRLRRYESLTANIRALAILIARWGQSEHREILAKMLRRLSDPIEVRSGKVAWLSARWFPIKLIQYSAGIAATSAQNYENLRVLLTTQVSGKTANGEPREIVVQVENGIEGLHRTGLYKMLPGHEKHYVPESEYLFKTVQPLLDDLLFLGSDYEILFDRFEILRTLTYVEFSGKTADWTWGPPGRFTWKHKSATRSSPIDQLIAEADSETGNWGPLKAGMFKRDYDHFKSVVDSYKQSIKGLHWF